MAKVFAVVRGTGGLKLNSWPSKKAFEQTERWTDEQFLCIADTDDYKNGMHHSPVKNTTRSGISVVYTDDQLEASQLICSAFDAHFKGKKGKWW